MILLNELDLGKSFDKLKKNLKDISNGIEQNPGGYANAFGRLSMAIKIHLIECTKDETFEGIRKYISEPEADDLKGVNI